MSREKYYSPKIYGLRCPIENQIVYVGVTKRYLSERLWRHLNPTKKDRSIKNDWINSLKGKGLCPSIELIESLTISDNPIEKEKEAIRTLRPKYNSNDGGNTPPPMSGHNKISLSQEVIESLGTDSDQKIADRYGINKSVITRRRKSLGITSFAERTGKDGRFSRSRRMSL